MLYLRAVEMSAVSRQTHDLMTGRVSSLKYYDDGEYLPAYMFIGVLLGGIDILTGRMKSNLKAMFLRECN